MFSHIRRIHMVGIGGSGMSGIAEVLLTLGYDGSGADLKETDATSRLRGLGARIALGHRGEQVGDAQVVVTSTAVAVENPEVAEARARGIPVIPRAEMLAELARLKYTVAIAGTHGKTTTTAMTAWVLTRGGLDPTIVIGGKFLNLGGHARLGQGEFLVAEADESDGSFLNLSPTIAIVTNVDDDHLDYYGSIEKIEEAFSLFTAKVPFYGAAILCVDDPRVRRLAETVTRRRVTYGTTVEAMLTAHGIHPDGWGVAFEVRRKGQRLGPIRLPIPGRHNALNALAAVAAGLEVGVSFADAADALAEFKGVERRLQARGEARGVTVVDDYGHHPTEIRATLAALKEHYPDRRLVVMFQPHRYSRTKLLYRAFGGAFTDAGHVVLLDVYPAGEAPIQGVSS
ncbi:MAG: UDP-N-acetylmuramate--L-alanine ligase, partial [bacterium]